MRLTTGEQLREMAKLLPRYEVTTENADVFRARIAELEAELAALRAKAAVPGWMTTPEAFAERAYHAGWRDLADAQHEGIAVMYDELLSAAPAQPQSDAVIVPRELANRLVSTDNHVRQTARRELRNTILGGEA